MPSEKRKESSKDKTMLKRRKSCNDISSLLKTKSSVSTDSEDEMSQNDITSTLSRKRKE